MQFSWVIGCLAGCLVSTAQAQPGAPQATAPAPGPLVVTPASTEPLAATAPDRELESYRLPLALTDTASLVLIVVGVAGENEGTAGLGTLGYALAGPIFHGAHGHGSRVGASLALRIGLPLMGALIGEHLGRHHHYHCDFDEICDESSEQAGAGKFLGMLGAVIIDDVFVTQPVELRPRSGVSWAPQVNVTGRHVGLGVVASF